MWLIAGLFIWVLFHLIFLAHDYPAQLMELRRIWKYAGLGALFAFGLGLSLASLSSDDPSQKNAKYYWSTIYFGLCLPVIIYLVKYILTTYGGAVGISAPGCLRINFDGNSACYIPKTDYIAFCLPVLALSLGKILNLITSGIYVKWYKSLALCIPLLVIVSILFIFGIQNTKNGIAYSAILIGLFLVLGFKKITLVKFWHKLFLLILVAMLGLTALNSTLQKNNSWETLIADARTGFQIDQFPQWRYAGEHSYPDNEYGQMVSGTNYLRAAWLKAGLQLATQNPLGYGLVEDSFKELVKARWIDASPNLSHSHSGWLDLILGIGFPGVFCIFWALLLNVRQCKGVRDPLKYMVFWTLSANLILWVTTEVAATTSFCLLVYWVSLSSGLTLKSGKRASLL